MAFRLPDNVAIGAEYPAVTIGEVTALENSLPPRSRMLVGLVFDSNYTEFLSDCERAENALREAGIPTWPEYDRLVTPDPDGEPIAWISYQSSPAFWTPILVIIGSIFLLPILSVLPVWIIDKLFPGAMDFITTLAVLGIMVGMMMLMPKMRKGAK
jgi:hypothetical protein